MSAVAPNAPIAPVPIRVVLADDHALVRAGIRSLLAGFAGVEVVGEAASGSEAIAQVDALRPDLLVVDVAMPDINGLQATAEVRKRQPAVRVLVLSMHTDAEYVARALQSGASGYLIKDAAPVELELALRAVVAGETWLSPQVSRQVVAGFVAGLPALSPSVTASPSPPREPSLPGPAAESAPATTLTPRQQEILRRIASGRSAKEIAYDLGISTKTVEAHRAQLMERLGIRDISGLTRYAIRQGLVSADD